MVMTHILDLTGFRAVSTLRKVCWDLRNFIEDLGPESHLKNISITVTMDSIAIYMDPFMDWSVDIVYLKLSNEECSVQNFPNKDVHVRDQDFVKSFLKDFEVNLKNQRAIIEMLRVSFECVLMGFLGGLEEVLRSRDAPLRVEELNLEVSNQEEIMSILPYIDSQSITKLSISSSQGLIDLGLDQVTNLKQWTFIKELEIFNCVVSNNLENFAHFSNAKISVQTINSEDLFMLKTRFLESENFEKSIIKYEIFKEDIYLPNLFGEPIVVGRDTWSWEFSGSDESLLLMHLDNRTFNFSRVKTEDIEFKECY